MLSDSLMWQAVSSPEFAPIALLVITASTFLYLLFDTVYTRFRYLRNVPGPWTAKYTRLWYLRTLASGKSADILVNVNDRYGSLARIGPKLLLTSDPEEWRRILDTRTEYKRGPWFDCLRLDPNRADLITEREKERHNLLRKQMAAAYYGKGIDGFMTAIDENLEEWIEYLRRNAVSSTRKSIKFDIARSIQWLDFDMVCRLCFGYPFGFIKAHEDQFEFQKMLEERLPIVEQIGVLAEVNSIIRAVSHTPLLKKILPSTEDASGVGRIRGMARKAVDARFQPDSKPKNDLLGSWLAKGLSRDQAETEMVIALFAGSDTTATAIRGALLHIITNPLVYTRLSAEIAKAQAEGRLSEPIVTVEEARALPYLQACISEGLRVFPPVTAMRERIVPPQGDWISGHHVPGGFRIGVNLRGLLADEKAFAPDPRAFRPDRWTEATPEQHREMMRVHELVFNWGSTRCLGMNLANIMMSKVLVEIFRRWDITLANPQQPWSSVCHGVFHQKDMFVRIADLSPLSDKELMLEEDEGPLGNRPKKPRSLVDVV